MPGASSAPLLLLVLLLLLLLVLLRSGSTFFVAILEQANVAQVSPVFGYEASVNV